MANSNVGDVLFSRGGANDDENIWDDTALIKAYDEAVSAFKVKLKSGAAKHESKKSDDCKTSNTTWRVNDYCQAIWSEDGIVYDAQIIDIFAKKATVRYIPYGNEEQHKLVDLLPPNKKSSDPLVTTEDTEFVDTMEDGEVSDDESSSSPSAESESFQRHPRATLPPGWSGVSTSLKTSGKQPSIRSSSNSNSQTNAPITPMMMAAPGAFPSPQINTGRSEMGESSNSNIPIIPPPPFPIGTQSHSGTTTDGDSALYSMLMSWYMSGYHTGYYQGMQDSKIKRQPKKKKR